MDDPMRHLQAVHQSKMMKEHMSLGLQLQLSKLYQREIIIMKAAGLRVCPPKRGQWNIYWAYSKTCRSLYDQSRRLRSASKYQRINHFPACGVLCKKDRLCAQMKRARELFTGDAKEYDFCPKTYCFPADYKQFCSDREDSGNQLLYISKPSDGCAGKGVHVIGPDAPVPNKAKRVVSEYISNPHLINGYKWDLR